MLSIQQLIRLETDILDNSKVKLIRHKDNRRRYRDVIKDKESLLNYQKEQVKDVFKNTDYIVSFIGQERSKSLLFGIFKVGKVEKINKKFHYELTPINICNDLIDRVIVDWGNSAIIWHQWYHKNLKEIIEILPKGYLGEFPGLTNFVLDFQELEKLTNNPDANRDWKNHLSSVNGIYMILDKKTGNQYIGSASGKQGIWQRWTEYSKNKHGDNTKLIELCMSSMNYHKNFQYTVLQSLPSNLTSKEVVEIEKLYKEKFGTRVHGLNKN
jgi:GIY-YIG catalytic domain